MTRLPCVAGFVPKANHAKIELISMTIVKTKRTAPKIKFFLAVLMLLTSFYLIDMNVDFVNGKRHPLKHIIAAFGNVFMINVQGLPFRYCVNCVS